MWDRTPHYASIFDVTQVVPLSENQNENISEIVSVTCLGSDGKIRK